MKIAFLTDTHFGVSKDDEYFMDHQLRFLRDVFFPYLREHHIRHIIHLGDVWDKRTSINIRTHDVFLEQFFDVLEQNGIQMTVIPGNHDVYYKNTNSINSLTHLKKLYPNTIHLVEDFSDVVVGDIPFAFFPWINNSNLESALQFAQISQARYAIGHFEVVGAEMMPGQICEHGLSVDMFSRFTRAFSGHFHIPSTIKNLEYIGNQFYLSWADFGTDKSFVIFDTETGQTERIANPDQVYNRFHYAEIQDLTDMEPYAGKIVDCVVTDFGVVDKPEFRAFVEEVRRVAHKFDISVKLAIETANLSDATSVVRDESGSLNTQQTILQCVDSIDVKGMDSAILKTMLSDLFQAATGGDFTHAE